MSETSAYRIIENRGRFAFIGCGSIRKRAMKEKPLKYNFFTVVCVQEGLGRYTDWKGRSCGLEPGSVFIRDIGQPHHIEILSDDWKEWYLVFKSFSIKKKENGDPAGPIDMNCLMPNRSLPHIMDETGSIIDALCAADRNAPVTRYPGINEKIPEFVELIGEIRRSANPGALQCRILALMSELTSRDEKTLSCIEVEAAELLKSTLSENRSIPEILSVLPQGYSSIRRRFQRYWNMTPGEYRIRCRMEQALFLLSDPSIPIKEIARRLGYGDQFGFSRQFHQFTGVSPSSYRMGPDGIDQTPLFISSEKTTP